MAAPTGSSPIVYGTPAGGTGHGFKKWLEDIWDALNPLTARAARTPYAVAAGVVTIAGGSGTTTNQTVSFPVGRFTVPPIVTVTGASSVPGTIVLGVGVDQITKDDARIHVHRTNSTNTNVHWIAVQMTDSSAAG